jgi:hypothetical protein
MHSTNHSCYILVNVEFSRQILEKSPNTKFHENPPSGKPNIPGGPRERERERDGRRDRQEDMTNLINAIPNFANDP